MAAKKKDKVKKEPVETWHANAFCLNCLLPLEIAIPAGVRIEEADCCNCRVRGTLKFIRKLS